MKDKYECCTFFVCAGKMRNNVGYKFWMIDTKHLLY